MSAYEKSLVGGVTVAGARQWINPEAFVLEVNPATATCTGGDSVRNTVRGPRFTNFAN